MAQTVKNLPAKVGDTGSNPESGRSPGKGNGNPLQYSCLGNPMNRGAWWAMVHGVTESDTIEVPEHTHHLVSIISLHVSFSLRMFSVASVMSDSATSWKQPTRLLCPWDPPGKNTGVDCSSLFQGIFLPWGSNTCLLRLLHCR